jgi:hypothetical protein
MDVYAKTISSRILVAVAVELGLAMAAEVVVVAAGME